jgi:hypothetical protein
MNKPHSRPAFTPLLDFLESNRIPPLTFLKACLSGEAPPVILWAGDFYLDSADESRWRASLGAKAAGLSVAIIARKLADAR